MVESVSNSGVSPVMPSQVENLLLEAGELLPDSPQAAFNLALKTLDLLEFQRDEPLLARVHMIAGVACQRLGQHALAIEHLIESRRLMLDLVDQRGQLEVGLELSRAYQIGRASCRERVWR